MHVPVNIFLFTIINKNTAHSVFSSNLKKVVNWGHLERCFSEKIENNFQIPSLIRSFGAATRFLTATSL